MNLDFSSPDRVVEFTHQRHATLDLGVAGDPFASRADADGTFTTIAAAADWTGSITSSISARLAVASQVAFQPLLVSEETGLCGGDFLRA